MHHLLEVMGVACLGSDTVATVRRSNAIIFCYKTLES
jgi:hypothetical protein